MSKEKQNNNTTTDDIDKMSTEELRASLKETNEKLEDANQKLEEQQKNAKRKIKATSCTLANSYHFSMQEFLSVIDANIENYKDYVVSDAYDNKEKCNLLIVTTEFKSKFISDLISAYKEVHNL